MQSTANLTLANAVEICRHHEAAKQAQSVVRPPTNATATGAVDMVKHRRNRQTPTTVEKDTQINHKLVNRAVRAITLTQTLTLNVIDAADLHIEVKRTVQR